MPRSRLKSLMIAASALVLGASAVSVAQEGRRGPGGPGALEGRTLTLFQGRGFNGQAITLDGETPRFGPIGVNDWASSAQVDGLWEVCSDGNYRGRCEIIDRDVVDFGVLGLNNQISSARPATRRDVRGGPGRRAQRRGADIVLYEGIAFTGDAVEIDFGARSLGEIGFNDRALSVRVNRGEWLICEHNNFRGRCEVINSDVRDLGRFGLNRRVSSIQPYTGQPYGDDIYGGTGSTGYGRVSSSAVEGLETVFFPDVRGPRGGKIRAFGFADDDFCREQGLRRAVYAGERSGFLTDVLCEK